MAWPSFEPAYNGRFEAARSVHANVARAISQFEPVVMLANEEDAALARTLCGPAVEVRAAPIDDGWFRDSGPTFVVGGPKDGAGLAGIDWDFNGWGGRAPTARDSKIASHVLAREGIERIGAPFVLEGGSFHVDGEGTLITTEECLLNANRNPHSGKREIEQNLREFLGVEQVIWLKGGPVDDVTDGHVDMVAAFARPGCVLALHCEDRSNADFATLRENRDILRNSRDARGRAIEVIDIPQAPASYIDRTGGRLGLSHVNFYMANGGIVLPWYGAPEHDEAVLAIFRNVFPDRRIVTVATRDLLYGGGNIHCITQQEPVATIA
jgi:agmatine deiminase